MSAQQDIVVHAARWIGTPYHHRASVLGAGADCLGLICGIWRARYGALPQSVPDYSPSWAESGPDELLWHALIRHFRATDRSEDGQVLLFRLQAHALAKHLGVQCDAGRAFIHACPRAGVVKAPLSDPWARRIVARFAFPPLTTEPED